MYCHLEQNMESRLPYNANQHSPDNCMEFYHAYMVKTWIFRRLQRWIKVISDNPKTYEQERVSLYNILQRYNYLGKMTAVHTNWDRMGQDNKNTEKTATERLPVLKGLSEQMQNICYDISKISRIVSTSRRYFLRGRPHIEESMRKNGVYFIPLSCSNKYKVETWNIK